MARRKYSDQDKAAALAVLDANGGNVLLTATQLRIPRKTLEAWSKQRGVHPDVAELRHEKRGDLAEKIEQELAAIFTALPQRRQDATYAQLVTAAGILIDKKRALEGAAEGAGQINININIPYVPGRDEHPA